MKYLRVLQEHRMKTLKINNKYNSVVFKTVVNLLKIKK